MPTITNEQRDIAFEAATEQQKSLCTSPESGAQLQNIASKHGIPEEKYVLFVLIAGDTVLGLRNQSDLPQFLQIEIGVTSEQALKITGDLIDFMDGKMLAEAKDQTPLEPGNLAAKPNPQVRTMAGDIAKLQGNEETVYSSTQEAILKEGRTGR